MLCMCKAWTTCYKVATEPPRLEALSPNAPAPLSHAARLEYAATHSMAHPLYFVCLMGFMGGVEAWTQDTSSLTQVVCTPAIHLIESTCYHAIRRCGYGTAPCTTDKLLS
jgi:hypothetical protein